MIMIVYVDENNSGKLFHSIALSRACASCKVQELSPLKIRWNLPERVEVHELLYNCWSHSCSSGNKGEDTMCPCVSSLYRILERAAMTNDLIHLHKRDGYSLAAAVLKVPSRDFPLRGFKGLSKGLGPPHPSRLSQQQLVAPCSRHVVGLTPAPNCHCSIWCSKASGCPRSIHGRWSASLQTDTPSASACSRGCSTNDPPPAPLQSPEWDEQKASADNGK